MPERTIDAISALLFSFSMIEARELEELRLRYYSGNRLYCVSVPLCHSGNKECHPIIQKPVLLRDADCCIAAWACVFEQAPVMPKAGWSAPLTVV